MSEEKKRSIPIEDGNEERKSAEDMAEETERADNLSAEEKSEDNTEENRSAGDADMSADDAGDAEKTEEGETGEAKAGAAEEEKSSEEEESERYMRLMAEFQNFRKRAAKEKSDIHAFANERIVSDLLPVMDNFERALSADNEGEASEEHRNYVKGMELIFEQLKAALEKAGVKEIPALGETFDPSVHNAVMTEKSEEYDEGKISKVLQKGYMLNDRVVRPAMVAVVKN